MKGPFQPLSMFGSIPPERMEVQAAFANIRLCGTHPRPSSDTHSSETMSVWHCEHQKPDLHRPDPGAVSALPNLRRNITAGTDLCEDRDEMRNTLRMTQKQIGHFAMSDEMINFTTESNTKSKNQLLINFTQHRNT